MTLCVEPGPLEILIGNSSKHIALRAQIEITGDKRRLPNGRAHFFSTSAT